MQPLTTAALAPRRRLVLAGRLTKRFAQRRAASITDAQINALRREAVRAIDVALIYLCDLALGLPVDPTDYVLGNDEIRVLTRDPAQARRNCQHARMHGVRS